VVPGSAAVEPPVRGGRGTSGGGVGVMVEMSEEEDDDAPE
jgi:hypothetical protein